LQALEQRLGAGPAKSQGPAGGSGAGRPQRREPEGRAPDRAAPEPKRGAPMSASHEPREVPHPAESSVGTIRAPAQAATSAQAATPLRTPVPVGGDDGRGDVPDAWREILAAVHESQPALGAVLDHAVPARVDEGKIRLTFPEGSFFGKQAASEQGKRALADAAERVLGKRPEVDVGSGSDSARATVAEVESTKRSERHAEIVKAALNHPRVKDAIEVFPEAEGQLDVQVED
jgi:hypothetical protein